MLTVIKPTLQKIYSDIDFTFLKKPGTNDVALSYDDKAVIRSVRNLVQTRHYDRLFNPDIGSKVDFLLFEPISELTASSIENEIRITINNFEPRVEIETIKVSTDVDNNGYNVTLSFYITNATVVTTTTFFLERTN
jgi:phage baseplate assembly protein W